MLATASSDVLIDATRRMTSTINLDASSRPHDCEVNPLPAEAETTQVVRGTLAPISGVRPYTGPFCWPRTRHWWEASVRFNRGANPIWCDPANPLAVKLCANYNDYKYYQASQNIKLSQFGTTCLLFDQE